MLRLALNSPVLDHRQQRREGVGAPDTGILQGVRLAPGHRGTDHLAAACAEPRVGLPGVHQGLQQRRLAGAGDAGQQRQRAAFAERVDGGALLGGERDAGVADRLPQCLDGEGPERSRALCRASAASFCSMRICAVLVTRTLSSNMPTTRATCSPLSRMPRSSRSSTTRLMSSGPPAMPVPIRPRAAYSPSFSWIDDRGGVELLGQVAGGECVGAIKSLLVGQAFVDHVVQGPS